MTLWIVLGIVVADRPLADRRLQRAGRRPEPGADGVEPDRRAAQAPPRSHSQPGAGREGRHGLRAGNAHQGDPGAQCRGGGSRARAGRPGRSGAHPGDARPARAWSRAIRSSRPTTTSSSSRKSSPATENKIAFARQFYNDSVAPYNTRRQSFPAVLAAASLGFGPMELFNMPESERKCPRSRCAERHGRHDELRRGAGSQSPQHADPARRR